MPHIALCSQFLSFLVYLVYLLPMLCMLMCHCVSWLASVPFIACMGKTLCAAVRPYQGLSHRHFLLTTWFKVSLLPYFLHSLLLSGAPIDPAAYFGVLWAFHHCLLLRC